MGAGLVGDRESSGEWTQSSVRVLSGCQVPSAPHCLCHRHVSLWAFPQRRSDLASPISSNQMPQAGAPVSDGNLQLSVGSLISFLTHMRPIKLSTLETWALETETIHRAAWSE